MTDRLVQEWTETAEEAFGKTGSQGLQGELIAKGILNDMGYEVEHYPNDKALQCAGIDLYLEGKYGIDVKANLHTGRDVVVDKPKLLKSKATFWMHINRYDPSDWKMYKVKWMIQLIEISSLPESNNLILIPRRYII